MTDELDIVRVVFQIAVLILSAVAHEVSHGFIAERLGDPTARNAGRLTLNPLKHLEWFGSFLLPVLMYIGSAGSFFFGWAKPVPYNPVYFKNPTADAAKVAFAGPATNFLIAIIVGLVLRFAEFPVGGYFERLDLLLRDIVVINIMLALFNLIPIPPLDGSKVIRIFFPDAQWLDQIEQYGFFILLFMLMFGLFSFLGPIIFFLYRLIVGSG